MGGFEEAVRAFPLDKLRRGQGTGERIFTVFVRPVHRGADKTVYGAH